jgi:hypothetical protein
MMLGSVKMSKGLWEDVVFHCKPGGIRSSRRRNLEVGEVGKRQQGTQAEDTAVPRLDEERMAYQGHMRFGRSEAKVCRGEE